MIYLDNAATSWPKPSEVYREVGDFLRRAGANPGRGGHALARAAAQRVDEVRGQLASFLGLQNRNQFVFTSNATEALNLAIKGALNPGDHVVTTSMEHNSVLRPLRHLQRDNGVSVTEVQADETGKIQVDDFKKAIRPETKLFVLTHASNVTGRIMPIEEVGVLARDKGIWFLVDAAQTIGEIPLNLNELPVDMLAFPGHKALMGPTGIGGLYIREGLPIKSLKEGGTGTKSELKYQPEEMPYKLESGTLNTSGIAGLGAALSYITKIGLSQISEKILSLTEQFIEGCQQIPGITTYGPRPIKERVGVVSLNLKGLAPDELGYILDEVYGIAVRAGLHCAPQAHESLGTYPAGAVRFSFSYFNSSEEIRAALEALDEISKQIMG